MLKKLKFLALFATLLIGVCHHLKIGFKMADFIVKKFCEQASEHTIKKLFEILENSANFVGKGTLKDKIEIWKRRKECVNGN